jgi:hypothetical protein
MNDKLRTPLRPPLKTQDLSAQQRTLVDLMCEYQFGRIENVTVREGKLILNREVRVIRLALLGGGGSATKAPRAGEFELKQAVRDLFDELARLKNGTVVRLEFKRGLPCLLEIVGESVF